LDNHKVESIVENTYKIFEYFLTQFKCRFKHPITLYWLSETAIRDNLLDGLAISTNEDGMISSMRAVARYFAKLVFDCLDLSDFKFDGVEGWFNEALINYLEIVSLDAVGIEKSSTRLAVIYKDYIDSYLFQAIKPLVELGVIIMEEWGSSSDNSASFYKKDVATMSGILNLVLLDIEIKEKSKQKSGFMDFIKKLAMNRSEIASNKITLDTAISNLLNVDVSSFIRNEMHSKTFLLPRWLNIKDIPPTKYASSDILKYDSLRLPKTKFYDVIKSNRENNVSVNWQTTIVGFLADRRIESEFKSRNVTLLPSAFYDYFECLPDLIKDVVNARKKEILKSQVFLDYVIQGLRIENNKVLNRMIHDLQNLSSIDSTTRESPAIKSVSIGGEVVNGRLSKKFSIFLPSEKPSLEIEWKTAPLEDVISYWYTPDGVSVANVKLVNGENSLISVASMDIDIQLLSGFWKVELLNKDNNKIASVLFYVVP
jgi:hypothetical protein